MENNILEVVDKTKAPVFTDASLDNGTLSNYSFMDVINKHNQSG